MKAWLRLVSWFNRRAKNFAIRLVKWTGKSKEYVHPKHLIHEAYQDWFLDSLKSDDVVLDLGCGDGAHSLTAAKSVRSIHGIDHSVRNLDIAQKLAAQSAITNVKFSQSSLEDRLSHPDKTYDVVFAFDILEHLNNRDQFLSEIHRLLKTGGRVYLSVPNQNTKWKKSLESHGLFSYSDLDHKHEYAENEIKQVMVNAGFEITYFDLIVYDTPWVGILDMLGGISLILYKRLSDWKRAMVAKHPSETTGFRIIARKI